MRERFIFFPFPFPLWCYGCACMFVMWQEVVTSGRGGCCQMMAPGGTMCEMKVGWERGRGGGRNERKTTQRRGREEPGTTNNPFLPSQPAVLQLLVDMDPGGAVYGGAAWKVSAGKTPSPTLPTLMVPQALQGLAITLESLKQTLPLSRLSPPPSLYVPDL